MAKQYKEDFENFRKNIEEGKYLTKNEVISVPDVEELASKSTEELQQLQVRLEAVNSEIAYQRAQMRRLEVQDNLVVQLQSELRAAREMDSKNREQLSANERELNAYKTLSSKLQEEKQEIEQRLEQAEERAEEVASGKYTVKQKELKDQIKRLEEQLKQKSDVVTIPWELLLESAKGNRDEKLNHICDFLTEVFNRMDLKSETYVEISKSVWNLKNQEQPTKDTKVVLEAGATYIEKQENNSCQQFAEVSDSTFTNTEAEYD